MFEWLENEIALIRTPRFHIVDGAAKASIQGAFLQEISRLPISYKAFVNTFGNAKLYRLARNDSYRIGIFATPRKIRARTYNIGFHDGALVNIVLEVESSAHKIVEAEAGKEETQTGDFETWLFERCSAARRAFGIEKWSETVRGPLPFSSAEQALIQSRQAMQWQVIGTDAENNHIFKITNTGNGTVPAITVGVRSKDGSLNGAVRIDVSQLMPGQTAISHVDFYKDLFPIETLEIFSLPDPEPEDREYYFEFDSSC